MELPILVSQNQVPKMIFLKILAGNLESQEFK